MFCLGVSIIGQVFVNWRLKGTLTWTRFGFSSKRRCRAGRTPASRTVPITMATLRLGMEVQEVGQGWTGHFSRLKRPAVEVGVAPMLPPVGCRPAGDTISCDCLWPEDEVTLNLGSSDQHRPPKDVPARRGATGLRVRQGLLQGRIPRASSPPCDRNGLCIRD